MYNGVGLQTARGSGTSGYVQRNMSALRYRDDYGNTDRNARRDRDQAGPSMRQPDQGILDHDRKRKVEVRCLELRDRLEEKGAPEEEIEDAVAQLRASLLESLADPNSRFGAATHAEARALRPSDVHALSAAKAAESEKWKAALGMRSDYVEGQGFSAEYHQRMRDERRAAREAKQAAWEAQQAERARRRADEEEERRQFDAEVRARRRDGRGEGRESRWRVKDEETSSPAVRGSERGTDGRSPPRDTSSRHDEPARPKRGDEDDRSRLPPPRRRRSPSFSRSPSPPPRRERYRDSPSPPPRRERRDSPSPPPRRERRRDSLSEDSQSRSPPPRRTRREDASPRDD